MAGLASDLLNVWAEIYDEQANVGGHGVPEILVKGEIVPLKLPVLHKLNEKNSCF